MTFEISEDRRTLTLIVDEAERAELRELKEDDPDRWGTTRMECEFCEGLTANSALDWVDPADTGDLTDAPILGIRGEDCLKKDLPANRFGEHMCGCWGSPPQIYYTPILERWGYLYYALQSFLEDLLETGKAKFEDRN